MKVSGTDELQNIFNNTNRHGEIDCGLNQEEKIINFFLGMFECSNENSLASELESFFDDLLISLNSDIAKGKNKEDLKPICTFCNYFADNSSELAKDILKMKPIILQKAKRAVNNRYNY